MRLHDANGRLSMKAAVSPDPIFSSQGGYLWYDKANTKKKKS